WERPDVPAAAGARADDDHAAPVYDDAAGRILVHYLTHASCPRRRVFRPVRRRRRGTYLLPPPYKRRAVAPTGVRHTTSQPSSMQLPERHRPASVLVTGGAGFIGSNFLHRMVR